MRKKILIYNNGMTNNKMIHFFSVGRRITILVGIVCMSISGIMIALVPNFAAFHVMRFINAMTSSGVFQTAFILGTSS